MGRLGRRARREQPHAAPDDDAARPTGPGALALEHLVDRADGGRPVHRYHPRAPNRFRGEGPLREVTAYRTGTPEHWHLVTYGLSELDAKESDDPDLSGWGFELTFRLAGADPVAAGHVAVAEAGADPVAAGHVAVAEAGADDPSWAADFLANLAAYVWTTEHPFGPGHHLDLSGPIRIGARTDLTAAVVVPDPGLPPLQGPFGLVELLQVVAITADELELCRSWSTEGVVELLRADDPLLVTRLERASVLAQPSRADEVRRRAAAEGSSLTELRVATLTWRQRAVGATVVQLGAGASAALGPALRRELVGEGASFRVVGDDSEVRFAVAATPGWRAGGGRLQVDVAVDQVKELAALFDGRTGWGHLAALKGLRFRVVP